MIVNSSDIKWTVNLSTYICHNKKWLVHDHQIFTENKLKW